ncbi:MAG: hypothetical protein Q8S18_07485 [Bacteroidales bacterium]|nr:hypothetical protein [Bacteroidales bacterium]
MEQDEFRKNIDELFRLFKKLLEKHPTGEIDGINRFQFEQLRLFLQNYDLVKDQLAIEMMGPMNEPMKQMLQMFLKQLREELGEEAEPAEVEISPVSEEYKDVQRIDEMLKSPGLSQSEIDRLLDERSKLMLKS